MLGVLLIVRLHCCAFLCGVVLRVSLSASVSVSKSKSKLMQRLALCSGDGSSDTSKDFVSGMASQLQVLQPRAHYLCGPLDAVAPVSRVLPVSNCTYNPGLPATIFATSQPHYLSVFRSSPPMQSSGVEELKDDSSGGSVISTRVNSTATALYTCQYGLPVDTSACAHLPVQADVAPGMQLLAPNYAYVGGGGSGKSYYAVLLLEQLHNCY